MNYKIGVSFVIGLGLGAFGAWQYAKRHFSEIADQEIASVKKAYSRESVTDTQEDILETGKEVHEKYLEVLKKSGYNKWDLLDEDEPADDEPPVQITKKEYNPNGDTYIIPPEEFGGADDYQQVTWTYYSDGVLADEDDYRVEDVAGTVGDDYADHFGEFDEDAVHIRNDRLMMDYEILRDRRKYADILKSKPYLKEG